MDHSFEPSTLLTVLHTSGMDSPPATLHELVELSQPDPYRPEELVPTFRDIFPGVGPQSVNCERLSILAQEAAMFPGNQTTFVNTNSGPTSTHVGISEELDAHIFDRRLLIQLYDADYPSPESSSELKDAQWKSERYYLCFAGSEDLKKLSHLRVLTGFLAGSVARREIHKASQLARKAKTQAMNAYQKQRFDAIRASWPETTYQSLDEYMNHQHDLSEQIWYGTVDINQPERPASRSPIANVQSRTNDLKQFCLPQDHCLDQTRDLSIQVLREMQLRTAKELIESTKQLESLGIEDHSIWKDLSQKQTCSAQQLVLVKSIISSLDITTPEQPPTPTVIGPTNVFQDEQSPLEKPAPAPVPPGRGGVFQNINWQDVRPFTPAAPQGTARSKVGIQQHIDSITGVQADPQAYEQQLQTPLRTGQANYPDGTLENLTPKSRSSHGFVGMSPFSNSRSE